MKRASMNNTQHSTTRIMCCRSTLHMIGESTMLASTTHSSQPMNHTSTTHTHTDTISSCCRLVCFLPSHLLVLEEALNHLVGWSVRAWRGGEEGRSGGEEEAVEEKREKLRVAKKEKGTRWLISGFH